MNFLNFSKSMESSSGHALYRYIDVKLKDGKKIPLSGDHKDYTVDQIAADRGNKRHGWISFSIKHVLDFYCIDFDNYLGNAINSYEDKSFLDCCELYEKLNKSGCYKSKTQKGYHFYVYIRNLGKYKHQQKVGSILDYEIDLLKDNNIWSPKTRKVTGEDVTYDWEDLKCYFNVPKMNFVSAISPPVATAVLTAVTASPVSATTVSTALVADCVSFSLKSKVDENLYKICDLIDVSYLDNRDSWIRIIWGLKNASFDHKELARTLS